MKILITGGCVFRGTNLTEDVYDQGWVGWFAAKSLEQKRFFDAQPFTASRIKKCSPGLAKYKNLNSCNAAAQLLDLDCMNKVDILIPTFNRVGALAKNLKLLEQQLTEDGLADVFQILVSDNASSDSTAGRLSELQIALKVNIKSYRQNQNIGLEKNVLFLLRESTAKYVMFLGDDDYLPSGYLAFVNAEIDEHNSLGAVIPGFSALRSDGSLTIFRSGKVPIRRYSSGYLTSLRLSRFGHQLSGLLLCREGLYEAYCKHPDLRNIYPFITFASINCMRGDVTFAPKYQVAVTVFNSKDWKYDDSGLLTEIFKNYYIVFNAERAKAYFSCCVVLLQQPWRLRLSNSPLLVYRSFRHLLVSDAVPLGLKLTLPVLYVLAFLKLGAVVCKRLLAEGRVRRR